MHNDRLNSTLGITPNEVLLGYRPILYPNQVIPSNNEAAETRMQTMFQKRAQAMAAINQATKPHITIPDQFQEGQMVWLEGTNLKLPYQSIKLALKRQGPFKIIKVILPVAFRLELPPSWTIHDVFHASLLTPYIETSAHGPNFIWPPPDLMGDQSEYEVEAVVNHRTFGRSKHLQYLLKWKGYPHSDNTWENATDVHAPDLIRDYHRSHPLLHKNPQAHSRTAQLNWTPQSTHSSSLPLPSSTPSITRSLGTKIASASCPHQIGRAHV